MYNYYDSVCDRLKCNLDLYKNENSLHCLNLLLESGILGSVNDLFLVADPIVVAIGVP